MKFLKLNIFFYLLLLARISFAQNEVLDCSKAEYEHLKKTQDMISSTQEWINCVKGKQTPGFTATSISGETIDTRNFRGKVLVINFWFIECHPCIAELPALNKLVKEYKDKDVMFLAPTYETKARLDTAFFTKYKFDFSIIPNAQKIRDMFGETGYPTTYVIDKFGKVRWAVVGGRTDKGAEEEIFKEAKPIIDELLNEK